MDESIVKYFQDQRVGKLSSAMRLGSMMRPDAGIGNWFANGGSCALAAAAEATGLPYREGEEYGDEVLTHVHRQLGASFWTMLRIILRHDFRGHSRERIADWLEGRGL